MKCDFGQTILAIAYKLNRTLQSEMNNVTVRSDAHSSGEHASEVERTAPRYTCERSNVDGLFEMRHDVLPDTPKHVFAQHATDRAFQWRTVTGHQTVHEAARNLIPEQRTATPLLRAANVLGKPPSCWAICRPSGPIIFPVPREFASRATGRTSHLSQAPLFRTNIRSPALHAKFRI